MRQLLMVIFRNIQEKKLRTLLIVLSIMFSTSLVFCSLTISDTLVNSYTAQIKKQVGTADIIVVEGERSEDKYFSMEPAEALTDELEYIVGGVIGHGYFEGTDGEKTIDLYGVTLEDLDLFNPIVYEEKAEDASFVGDKVIISAAFAKSIGVAVGDTLPLTIGDEAREFTVHGISKPVGPFTDGTLSAQAVLPKKTYQSIVQAENDEVRIICLKLKDGTDPQRLIKQLSKRYPNNSVREAISQSELDQRVGPLSTSFMIVSMVVILLSAFIILSSFRVISIERMPLLGTFRSVGAEKSKVIKLLLSESLMYGAMGGLLGCISGIAVLKFFSSMMASPGIKTSVSYSIQQLLLSFLFAFVLAIAVSIVPIVKVSNQSTRDILLNHSSTKTVQNHGRSVVGILFILFRIILPRVVPESRGLVAGLLSIVLSVLGIILLMPLIIKGGLMLLQKVNQLFFGNVGMLATLNLRQNKNMQNSVTLLTIGVASLLLINVVTTSVIRGMSGVFSEITTFDVYTSPNHGDDRLKDQVLSNPQVTDVFSFYTALGVYVMDKNDEISVIEGVNTKQYLDYVDIDFENGQKSLYELDHGRNILISSMIRNKWKLSKGDTLVLSMEADNIPYKVIGFFDSTIYGSNYGIVSEKNLKEDMQLTNYSFMYLKGDGDAAKLANTIKRSYPDEFKDVYTIDELIENDQKNNGMIFYLLNAFSLLSMLIGIFGIINNLIVNYLERKRVLAVLKSVGMSRKQSIKMFVVEAITSGMIGGMTGVFLGLSMLWLIPDIMVSLGLFYKIDYSVVQVLFYIGVSIVIMVIASILPVIKVSKLRIIEALKFE